MANAYIVCGPVSSGNRLLASILCRSGCDGEGSTEQPQTVEELPKTADKNYVCIKHRYFSPWINQLRKAGYENITIIIIVREPIANISSMLKWGHTDSIETAKKHRTQIIVGNILEGLLERVNIEIITYEGLNEKFLKNWLPTIGLEYVEGRLVLPGQNAPPLITNQNGKHYVSSDG